MEYIWQGYNAFKAGVEFTKCPYCEGSRKWMDWTSGWINAERRAKSK